MTSALFLTLAVGVAAFGQTAPLHLRVSMISLGVKDSARSIQFYTETLGLEIVGKPGEVTLLRAGDIMIVLNRPAGQAAKSALKQRGCSFVAVPHEVTTNMWAATFTDPDGHMLTILGPQ
jgi:catechol 2,3-dioxygenase-like lactoylglutathione lyase family enzyme